MKQTITTFYAVRVTRFYKKDGKDPVVLWVQMEAGFKRGEHGLVSDQARATRYKSISKAKRAIKYACVRDALARTSVEDRERVAKMKAKRPRSYWMFGTPTIRCRHEAEVVKLTETCSYEEEVVAALPKRSPIEQLARQAE
jgi:hypothetical protein